MYTKLLKIFAELLIVLSMLLLIFESMTSILSRVLCRNLCHEHYVSTIEPKIVDLSCSFNTDMYLNFSLVLFLILGIMLNVLSTKVSIAEENQ
jgi:hypothetical protein